MSCCGKGQSCDISGVEAGATTASTLPSRTGMFVFITPSLQIVRPSCPHRHGHDMPDTTKISTHICSTSCTRFGWMVER